MTESLEESRVVGATHGLRHVEPDPDFEIGMAQHLKVCYETSELLSLYARFAHGVSDFDSMMRRVLWRSIARRLGYGVSIGIGVGFRHLETFEIGDGVFIGDHAYIQGRHDGETRIGDHTWIGPQAYLDARHLILEEYVGWGPGAKVVGSTHTGLPVEQPMIQTDLEIKPVRVEAGADVGAGAVLLPGVRIGKGSLIGAGAVVTRDVPAFTVVAGVPARVIRHRDREDHKLEEKQE